MHNHLAVKRLCLLLSLTLVMVFHVCPIATVWGAQLVYITGRVTGTDAPGGLPATVTLIDLTTGNQYGKAAICGADGSYMIVGESSGIYQLIFTMPGYITEQTASLNLSSSIQMPDTVMIKGTPVITGISIYPVYPQIEPDDTLQMHAVVSGDYYPSQNVNWSVRSDSMYPVTQITKGGLLYAARNQKADLVVRAESSGIYTETTVPVSAVNSSISISIKNVGITPVGGYVEKGGQMPFSAKVLGVKSSYIYDERISQEVIWSVTGNQHTKTAINANGILTVAPGEEADVLTIQAQSVQDTMITESVTVELLPPPSPVLATGLPRVLEAGEGLPLVLEVELDNPPGDNQTYYWIKDGEFLAVTDTGQLIQPSASYADEGDYYVYVVDAAGDTPLGSVKSSLCTVAVVPTYNLVLEAGNGGSITKGTSGLYIEGDAIELNAVPDPGYTFSGWSAASGTFGNKTAANTTFTMPDTPVTVRAAFTPVSTSSNNPQSSTNTNRHGSKAAEQGPEPGAEPVEEPPLENKTAVSKAYLTGYPDGTFRPDTGMTRAEAAMLLYNLAQNGELVPGSLVGANPGFADVPANAWHYEAVSYLAETGAVSGYPDGTFMPDNTVTRAEFAAMLARFMGLSGGSTSFADVPPEHWASGSIAAMERAGYVSGYPDGSFGPGDAMTRAQAVTVLNNVLNRDTASSTFSGLAMPFGDVPIGHWAYYEIMAAAVEHTVVDGR